MECLSDNKLDRMALSYMQESQLTAVPLAMKQEEQHHHQQAASAPLNNNTSLTAASALFSNTTAMAAAAASLSHLTPQQLLAAQMSMSIMAGLPSLYSHPQLFGAWMPPSAASPPLPLGPVSPALSAKSSGSSRRTPTQLNINNNIVSSSIDHRPHAKKPYTAMKKKAATGKSATKMDTAVVDGAAPGTITPPNSVSPDHASKDGAKDKLFTCGVCQRSFGYKHVLQNHERTHTGEKPFECPTCKKRFTRDHHLKTHMRLHTGEKPYHCNHCERQFVQVANLRRHLRVHTGERPYACEMCSAKFSDSNQLKAHVLIHNDEKPFECEHCLLRFRRRHHLVHHKCAANPTTMTTMLPQVTAQLDADDDQEVDMVEQAPSMLSSPSAPIAMPLNLSALPEQTEPEDLSMASSRQRGNSDYIRPQSHSSGGDSPPSDNEEMAEEDDEELDVARASPSSLFALDARHPR